MVVARNEPIRQLQVAVRVAAGHVAPGVTPGRVVVFDAAGDRMIDLRVPPGCPESERAEEPAAVAGWQVAERVATYDGRPVAVAPSRLKLLRTLVEADAPMSAKELATAAFDRATDEQNVRYHVKELKRELKVAFPSFDSDVIEGTGEGYRLVLR